MTTIYIYRNVSLIDKVYRNKLLKLEEKKRYAFA